MSDAFFSDVFKAYVWLTAESTSIHVWCGMTQLPSATKAAAFRHLAHSIDLDLGKWEQPEWGAHDLRLFSGNMWEPFL